MLLSEAIRLGPTVCPAIYGPVFEDWDKVRSGEPCGACRMGATAFVAGFRNKVEQGSMFDWMRSQWPILVTPAEDPLDGCVHDVQGLIIYMHEHHRWSADQIADWVATIESKEQHDLQPVADQNVSYMPCSSPALPGGVDK